MRTPGAGPPTGFPVRRFSQAGRSSASLSDVCCAPIHPARPHAFLEELKQHSSGQDGFSESERLPPNAVTLGLPSPLLALQVVSDTDLPRALGFQSRASFFPYESIR